MKVTSLEIIMAVAAKTDAPTRLGLFMSEYARRVGGELATNILPENAPVELPRISAISKNFVVNLGLDRLQFAVKPQREIQGSLDKVVESASLQSSALFEQYLSEVGSPYTFCGAIMTLHFSRKGNLPQLKIAEQLHDSLLNLERNNNPLASFLLQTGYQTKDHYLNFTLSAYETRTLKIPPNLSPGTYQVDISNTSILESGVQVRVDLNNRPKTNKQQPMLELKSVLQMCRKEADGVSDRFMLDDTGVVSTPKSVQ
jgi:hypothetical protein